MHLIRCCFLLAVDLKVQLRNFQEELVEILSYREWVTWQQLISAKKFQIMLQNWCSHWVWCLLFVIVASFTNMPFWCGKPIKFQFYTFGSEDDQVTDTRPRTNIGNLSLFKVVKGICSSYLVDSAYVCYTSLLHVVLYRVLKSCTLSSND